MNDKQKNLFDQGRRAEERGDDSDRRIYPRATSKLKRRGMGIAVLVFVAIFLAVYFFRLVRL